MDMKRWIITGWRGAGKTTFCQRFLQQAVLLGWDAAGLLSLAVFEDGQKTGIDLLDIRGGVSKSLASRQRQTESDLVVGRWFFNPAVMAWGSTLLDSACPCGALVVDELGPLELIQNQGWVKALDVIEKGDYRLALIVIRPELLDQAVERFKPAGVIEMRAPGEVETTLQRHLPAWQELFRR